MSAAGKPPPNIERCSGSGEIAELFSLIIRQVVPCRLIRQSPGAGLRRHIAIVGFVSGNMRRAHGLLLCHARENARAPETGNTGHLCFPVWRTDERRRLARFRAWESRRAAHGRHAAGSCRRRSREYHPLRRAPMTDIGWAAPVRAAADQALETPYRRSQTLRRGWRAWRHIALRQVWHIG